MASTSRLLGAGFLTAAIAISSIGCAADTGDEEEVDNDSEALAAGVQIETHFTRPKKAADGTQANDPEIIDHLKTLIRETPAGGEIRLAIHSFTLRGIKNELLAAMAPPKNVKVFVVHNGADDPRFKSHVKVANKCQTNDQCANGATCRPHDGEKRCMKDVVPSQAPKELADALGAAHRWCGDLAKGGDAGACISTRKSSIMHAKYALFSARGGRSHVVWLGSANMTAFSGMKLANNTLTIYGDKKLYDQFKNRLFAQMWDRDKDTLVSSFGSKASGISVWPSPSDTDLVLARLAGVHPSKDCTIRVEQAFINGSRIDLVQKLAELKDGGRGCKVRVNAHSIHKDALRVLAKAKIPVHRAFTHDKLVLIDADYGPDKKHQRFVLTGSHNWSRSANFTNDELLVRVNEPSVVKAFVTRFQETFAQGEAFAKKKKTQAFAAVAADEDAADAELASVEDVDALPDGDVLSSSVEGTDAPWDGDDDDLDGDVGDDAD